MPQSTPEQSLTDALITLKSQYEQALTEADTKAILLREKLSHVNALLLNQLVPSHGVAPLQVNLKSAEPVLDAIAQAESYAQRLRLSLAPAIAKTPARKSPKPTASNRKAKAAPEPGPVSGKRSPRPLLPAYQGLTRLEAIAQLLQANPGQDVTADQVSEGLFGALSAAEHKAERKSLNTQLYKGVVQKLWQKGTAPATFLIGAPENTDKVQPTTPAKAATQLKPKAPATKAKATKAPAQRKSLPLLPAYAQLTKQEAIAQILGQHPGEELHHDTIIQMLYGDLSPQELKEERVRIKTALLTGVKDGKWQKASVPSSYFLNGQPPARADRKTGAKAPAKRKASTVANAPARRPRASNKSTTAKKVTPKQPRPKKQSAEVEAVDRENAIFIFE